MNANFKTLLPGLAIWLAVALILAGCTGAGAAPVVFGAGAQTSQAEVSYTLKSELAGGRMVLVGQGGEIDGLENPQLVASPGQTVQITLVNGDGAEHDIAVPGLGVDSEQVRGSGSATSVIFEVHQEGKYAYYCTVAGHREAGMSGWLVVGRGAGVAGPAEPVAADETGEQGNQNQPAGGVAAEPVAVEAPSIVRDPADLPGPIGERAPQAVIEAPFIEQRLDIE